ncbi:winged helix DNA-binding domain-containing protein [Fredinandcohnia quinoae]|uniref:Winged helix DNA-binding domain-containing protein n=1 Tax=Fredinandcohnia quinoae TaxID=2918902 RepID=A0AAW5E7B1_9BACI|nr:winged helix DNA-binding domain-containing protein [Fredinandcohnia sp. SECRCQ15]MCH1625286.1 winged helix DNA-binding domain-containing protein [Fredinandcohnia sp. SECRCQ15]
MVNNDIGYQRLFNQRIEGRKFERPEDVVRWMGAIQAQSYNQSLWAIGIRMNSPNVSVIENAIANGKIVRVSLIRGTIHFVPPEDARWMLNLSAPRILPKVQREFEKYEIDQIIVDRCMELFSNALKGGNRLTRLEMMKLLEDAGINTKNQRGYHILLYASQIGLICFGPKQDKEQTFVLLDEWISHSDVLTREESIAKLAMKYFISHGPATIHDFAWWSGLTVKDAKMGLGAINSMLSSENIMGKEYWAERLNNHIAYNSPNSYLLPGYDEFILGYKDRSDVLADEHASKIVPGNNGVFQPTIVINGQIAGTWKPITNKGTIDLTYIPFSQYGVSEKSIIESANWYSKFIGLPLSSTTIQEDHEPT